VLAPKFSSPFSHVVFGTKSCQDDLVSYLLVGKLSAYSYAIASQ